MRTAGRASLQADDRRPSIQSHRLRETQSLCPNADDAGTGYPKVLLRSLGAGERSAIVAPRQSGPQRGAKETAERTVRPLRGILNSCLNALHTAHSPPAPRV